MGSDLLPLVSLYNIFTFPYSFFPNPLIGFTVINPQPAAYDVKNKAAACALAQGMERTADMNKKAKIVVLHLKELIYTGIFLILGILFVILLVMMFSPRKDSAAATSLYTPGQYTTSLTFNGNVVDVKVTVDEDKITSISLDNLEETVSVMYPLMEPALEDLSSQILASQSLDNITYSNDNKYTSMLLLDAIASSLEQARKE